MEYGDKVWNEDKIEELIQAIDVISDLMDAAYQDINTLLKMVEADTMWQGAGKEETLVFLRLMHQYYEKVTGATGRRGGNTLIKQMKKHIKEFLKNAEAMDHTPLLSGTR